MLNGDDIPLKRKHSIFNISKNMVIFPWATNLLPNKIDENIKNLENVEIKPICGHIGTTSGSYAEPYRLFGQELKNTIFLFPKEVLVHLVLFQKMKWLNF